uniref:Uncharacterized protein n=1 Tax=Psilocybe cubensis TaxID=181762 RepID=A0A8H8CKG5_PSICU
MRSAQRRHTQPSSSEGIPSMSGSLSNHLINSHYPDSPFNSSIVSHGPMSFNPMMHGTPYAQQSFSLFNSQSFANDSISEETAKKIAILQAKLDRKLGPEYISQRPGPGGGPRLTYVEGWKIINLANEVFGFNGWSSSVVSLTTDFTDYSEESRRYSVGVTAIVRVTLRDGVFHEDTGYGMLENSKSKGAALDKCKKEAVTDGLKRALRNFGNVMGNCLYDKSYTAEVIKMKVEPVKFNKDVLHRRPECDEVKPNVSISSTGPSTSAGPSNTTGNMSFQNQAVVTPTRPPYQQNATKPLTSIPVHMRPGISNASIASGSATTSNTSMNQANDHKGKARASAQERLNAITAAINTPDQCYNAQQQQIQHSERRVSFSETNKVDGGPAPAQIVKPPGAQSAVKQEPDIDDDDSFGFGSEDDALFAMADLGPAIGANDADMGRPIQHDVEMGRPIDHEEGLLQGIQEADDSAVFTVHPAARAAGVPDQTISGARLISSKHASTSGSNSNKSRQELIEAALREGKTSAGDQPAMVPAASTSNTTTTATSTAPGQGLAAGMLSSKLNPQQQQMRSSSTYGNSTGSASSSGNNSSSSAAQMPPPGVPAQLQSKATSISQQNHQRYMNQRQQQQQQNGSAATGQQPPPRAPTPAIGGFNFPGGVNPITSTANFASGIGVKRPIEATSSSNYRGARPGMGLHQVPTTSSTNNPSIKSATTGSGRSVLGSLEIEEGGMVKRARQG